MITPKWEDLFVGLEGSALPERTYPYAYQDLPLLKLFVYARIKGITGFQTLQRHLQLRPDVVQRVGLEKVPHRKTLAERFRDLPDTVSQMLMQLTETFIETGDVNASIASVDSTLMHAQGNVWHKKQRDKGELPSCGNIDQEAHWGKSGCGEWVYGYRLHPLTLCGPEGITWPAAISVHAANVKDADVFDDELIEHLPTATQVLLGDGGYDHESCYLNCDEREVTLLAPIKVQKTRHPNVSSALSSTRTRNETFALRKTTVEPFQGQLKDLFGLEHLLCRGLNNVRALCCFSVLAYVLLVVLNLEYKQPPTQLKAMMLALR